MAKIPILFFFLLFLAIAIVSAHITIEPEVLFSFGCDPSEPLSQNCTYGGNYQFKTILLNNESPAYSFSDIKLYNNYSMWDDRMICRAKPFYQPVWFYSDIFNWECCTSDWQINYTQCTIGDNHTLVYYDINHCFFPNNIPPDNGTISYCNYCSEDLQATYGECLDNSTQSVDWFDFNKNICCDMTNLPTDCSIYTYPFNETTWQGCNSTNANIGIPVCRTNPELADRGQGSKEDCVIEIPDQYRNDDYKCFSLVKEKSSGRIVQVNPDQNRTYPVLESREYFTPLYSTVNFYYTSENLQPEKDYVVRLECSSQNRIIYSEYPITRSYENLSWIYYRMLWLKANAVYIVGGVIILILLGIAFVVIKNAVF